MLMCFRLRVVATSDVVVLKGEYYVTADVTQLRGAAGGGIKAIQSMYIEMILLE